MKRRNVCVCCRVRNARPFIWSGFNLSRCTTLANAHDIPPKRRFSQFLSLYSELQSGKTKKTDRGVEGSPAESAVNMLLLLILSKSEVGRGGIVEMVTKVDVKASDRAAVSWRG